jgi:hypothetical protein
LRIVTDCAIQSRDFSPSLSVAQIPATPVDEPPQSSKHLSRKRGRANPKAASMKPAPGTHGKLKKPARVSDSGEEDEALEDTAGGRSASDPGREGSSRRSLRKQTLTAGGYRETDGNRDDAMMVNSHHDSADADTRGGANKDASQTSRQIVQQEAMVPDPESEFSPSLNVDTEGEDEKPKLLMRVTYRGFTIYDRCLCLIIEPWPALRDTSRARYIAPSLAQHPDNFIPFPEQTPVSLRERTPLFLPDLDSRRSATPAPLPSRFRPRVPLSADNIAPEDEVNAVEGGMMAFSQVLKSVGGERAGSADDDENEGDVFLGDADERRGDQ